MASPQKSHVPERWRLLCYFVHLRRERYGGYIDAGMGTGVGHKHRDHNGESNGSEGGYIGEFARH